jgi:hypothetical protein
LRKVDDLGAPLYLYGFMDYEIAGEMKSRRKKIMQTRFCFQYYRKDIAEQLPRGFYMAFDAPNAYTESS